MQKIAIIVAGGAGVRMGSATPKQFLLLHGKPVLQYSLQAFLDAYDDLKIILVIPEAHFDKGNQIIEDLQAAHRVTMVNGGETRFHSVKNGLAQISLQNWLIANTAVNKSEESAETQNAVVFVHDGVRCLISKELIRRCYEQTIEKGSAIPAVTATDSIRIMENGIPKVANRDNIRIIQTPQTFLSNLLLEAFAQTYNPLFTDEATVVEAANHPIFLTEGEYNNIKITRPADLLLAESIISGSQQ
ncbi:2-C-methyl-D-erythritol 4-phosphate cytidylyltransferase [Filimonas effusa]|uniref:2-C-methyl-D-erythritol 4-phosphate cytidylyltransferase n=1 Tax=Filimonas effusa TaxID=2508721 RepID=A0A4V1MAM9_9BACT|nr:2-C-methyl-D-erythritol 4-phosphate cytidylyltransferase [Filimonas effusa]RXK86436.1 2-C-methyl-D-erythritol 4-phosphate cytidylyltransferase [Filimonas effusa]